MQGLRDMVSSRKDSFGARFLKRSTSIFYGRDNGDINEKYELGEEFCRGSCGTIRKAVDKVTLKQYACKTVLKNSAKTQEQVHDLRLEAEIMLHLRGHPNILKIMGCFEDEECIYIVEELCHGGDLYKKFKTIDNSFSERDAAKLMRSILEVVAHCHAHGVIHRDIKPENFLLTVPNKKAVVKATDFGVSRFLQPDDYCTELCGTPRYLAPEVFKEKYGFPSDVWSCGIIMYFMLSGHFPFGEKDDDILHLSTSIMQDPVNLGTGNWVYVSKEGRDLLAKLLEKDPNKRITAADALQHRWLACEGCAPSQPLGGGIVSCLLGYVHMNEFKKLVMRMVVHELDIDYVVGLRVFFAALDKDEDGALSAEDIMEGLKNHGNDIDVQKVKELIREMDKDGLGVIDYTDFLAAALNKSVLQKKDLLRTVFAYFDPDGLGFITPAQLREVLSGGLAGAYGYQTMSPTPVPSSAGASPRHSLNTQDRYFSCSGRSTSHHSSKDDLLGNLMITRSPLSFARLSVFSSSPPVSLLDPSNAPPKCQSKIQERAHYTALMRDLCKGNTSDGGSSHGTPLPMLVSHPAPQDKVIPTLRPTLSTSNMDNPLRSGRMSNLIRISGLTDEPESNSANGGSLVRAHSSAFKGGSLPDMDDLSPKHFGSELGSSHHGSSHHGDSNRHAHFSPSYADIPEMVGNLPLSEGSLPAASQSEMMDSLNLFVSQVSSRLNSMPSPTAGSSAPNSRHSNSSLSSLHHNHPAPEKPMRITVCSSSSTYGREGTHEGGAEDREVPEDEYAFDISPKLDSLHTFNSDLSAGERQERITRQVESIMKQVDKNRDGVIDFKEFQAMMMTDTVSERPLLGKKGKRFLLGSDKWREHSDGKCKIM